MDVLKIIIEAYLLWIIIFFVLSIFLSNKRILSISLTFVFIYFIIWIGKIVKIDFFESLFTTYNYQIIGIFILLTIILATPDIRVVLEEIWDSDKKDDHLISSDKTKDELIDAVLALSNKKIGALITIEKFNTLDQYAEKAIMLNSDISKEVLLNIFTPNTPLHDGAVIIRGDKILCAAAYFTLSAKDNLGKTVGSRHRAGLGISEITDSLTIIVSEETGKISIAFEGILLAMNDKDRLNEYIQTFMR